MCSNCYNGCVDITSDKCVKYTGVDVPVLGIKSGDSLSYVEQALVTFLTGTLDGTGIAINIDSSVYCTLVSDYLQTCTVVTALDLFKALIQAACNLQTQINATNTTVSEINGSFELDPDCLPGTSSGAGIHTIVQAVINKLCTLNTSFAAFYTDVTTNYVKLSDLDALIAAYLATITTSTKYYTKMIPYTVVEYYGTLTGNFDATGAGITSGLWEKIYLCNGNNGTPDKRGRVPVGAINGVPGPTLPSSVNPSASALNPNYTVGDTTLYGYNDVTLDYTNMPPHVHAITDVAHAHYTVKTITSGTEGSNTTPITNLYPISSYSSGEPRAYDLKGTPLGSADEGLTSSVYTGITGTQSTGGASGAAVPFSVTQPVKPCYYIMHIP